MHEGRKVPFRDVRGGIKRGQILFINLQQYNSTCDHLQQLATNPLFVGFLRWTDKILHTIV